jgi:hypothetical protein
MKGLAMFDEYDNDLTSAHWIDYDTLARMSMDDVVAELDGCVSHSGALHLADNCNGEVAP